ncbi:hypothetical protein GCM10010381_04810 [Streptomyces xantholiticus]|nr:hypothetical protein GCM10010381_04810 [Streptomyces xantholiticus]
MRSDPILYVSVAETALDAEVAVGHRVVARRGDLDDLILLHGGVRLQPTPRYAHTVGVRVCADSSQVPDARVSNSDFKDSAPVGYTSMQFPQYTHAESVRGASCSVEIRESKPRPATAMAKVFCRWSLRASTHLWQRMHLSWSRTWGSLSIFLDEPAGQLEIDGGHP